MKLSGHLTSFDKTKGSDNVLVRGFCQNLTSAGRCFGNYDHHSWPLSTPMLFLRLSYQIGGYYQHLKINSGQEQIYTKMVVLCAIGTENTDTGFRLSKIFD